MEMFRYEGLAKDVRRVAVNDLVLKCKNVLEIFQELHDYQSRHATKDNYHGDELPITNKVVSKISQVVTSLEEVSEIIKPRGPAYLDPQGKLYWLN